MDIKMEFETALNKPIYPNLPVYISQKELMLFAEQIAIASIQVTDPRGLKIMVRGNLAELADIALETIGKYLHCEVKVLYSEDEYK